MDALILPWEAPAGKVRQKSERNAFFYLFFTRNCHSSGASPVFVDAGGPTPEIFPALRSRTSGFPLKGSVSPVRSG